MKELPYARKIFKCGQVIIDNEVTIDPKKGCGQEIFKDKDGLVKNLKDDVTRGGLHNERHICPNRVGSQFHHFEPINMRSYDWHEQHKTCVICALVFNSQRMPLCPHCFKLKCRSCGNLQSWTSKHGALCFKCKGKTDVQQVFWSFMRLENK